MKYYQVYVGNIGLVGESNDFEVAFDVFGEYLNQSMGNYGRASGESVAILDCGEPMTDYDYSPRKLEDKNK